MSNKKETFVVLFKADLDGLSKEQVCELQQLISSYDEAHINNADDVIAAFNNNEADNVLSELSFKLDLSENTYMLELRNTKELIEDERLISFTDLQGQTWQE